MRARIEQELELLREHYPDIQHKEHSGEDWFYLPRYMVPTGWQIDGVAISEAPIVFKIVATYPAGEPYGFSTPAGINFNSAAPNNTSAAGSIPFSGAWQLFSWAPDGSWAPANNVRKGSNLLAWVRSFAQRLREGA